jgi:aspartyl/asparaginyl-tRNA synthetase
VTDTQQRLAPARLWQSPGDHHRYGLVSPWCRMLSELQTTFTESTIDFWRERRAKTLHLPLTTGSISSPMGAGSDSKPVHIDLLGAPTYLADSMQFMLEYGCRLTGSETYYVMPSFRGEQTDARHLAQFFHSEAEIPGGLDDVVDVVQKYLMRLATDFLAAHEELIGEVAGTTEHVAALADGDVFRRLTFDEAAALLDGEGVEQHGGWRSLSREAELELMRRAGQFTWVTHWDHLSVPFYQAYGDAAGRTALNGDLLFGIGETVGAGERHADGDQVLRALAQHEVDPAPYGWYLDIRAAIPLRTAGFGLGVERFLLWLTDHDDIRDMQLLPRENGQVIVP